MLKIWRSAPGGPVGVGRFQLWKYDAVGGGNA
jgi:hypothetical protein